MTKTKTAKTAEIAFAGFGTACAPALFLSVFAFCAAVLAPAPAHAVHVEPVESVVRVFPGDMTPSDPLYSFRTSGRDVYFNFFNGADFRCAETTAIRFAPCRLEVSIRWRHPAAATTQFINLGRNSALALPLGDANYPGFGIDTSDTNNGLDIDAGDNRIGDVLTFIFRDLPSGVNVQIEDLYMWALDADTTTAFQFRTAPNTLDSTLSNWQGGMTLYVSPTGEDRQSVSNSPGGQAGSASVSGVQAFTFDDPDAPVRGRIFQIRSVSGLPDTQGVRFAGLRARLIPDTFTPDVEQFQIVKLPEDSVPCGSGQCPLLREDGPGPDAPGVVDIGPSSAHARVVDRRDFIHNEFAEFSGFVGGGDSRDTWQFNFYPESTQRFLLYFIRLGDESTPEENWGRGQPGPAIDLQLRQAEGGHLGTHGEANAGAASDGPALDCLDCFSQYAGIDPVTGEPTVIYDVVLDNTVPQHSYWLLHVTQNGGSAADSPVTRYRFRVAAVPPQAATQPGFIPLPPAVWALGASLALFGVFASRRRCANRL